MITFRTIAKNPLIMDLKKRRKNFLLTESLEKGILKLKMTLENHYKKIKKKHMEKHKKICYNRFYVIETQKAHFDFIG
jgi:hypothetical protein